MTSKEYIDRLYAEMQQKNMFSSEYIEQCCAYAEHLLKQNLPVFFDGQHIGDVLRLRGIRQDCYHEFHVPKKNGGFRRVLAPSRPLKARQRWILRNILSRQEISPHAQGFCPDRSIVTNAAPHINYKHTICADIQDFFPSIKAVQVEAVFQDLGYSCSAAQKLASLCCYDAVLPQGAPTSPFLSNIIFRELDKGIAEWADCCRAVYTRYADDITISANEDVSHMVPILQQMLFSAGFSLNPSKTRYFDPDKPKRITGLVVQDTVRIPKRFKRQLRQEIYYCKKFGVSAHLDNASTEKRIHFKEHLYGKAYYIKMVEPAVGAHFLKELSEIEWPE